MKKVLCIRSSSLTSKQVNYLGHWIGDGMSWLDPEKKLIYIYIYISIYL